MLGWLVLVRDLNLGGFIYCNAHDHLMIVVVVVYMAAEDG